MNRETKELDLLIIGAGPAGISAAYIAKQEGLNYLVIEKGLIANTIYNYPLGRLVFSTPNELEFHQGDLVSSREKPTREELLSYYVRFVLDNNLHINTEEEAIHLEQLRPHLFSIRTTRNQYLAKNVLVAIGAMAYPKRLNIPGEDLPKVFHRFTEPYPYVRKNALVVGGGNSAAEAALFLAEDGAKTSLAIWRSDWENRDPKQGCIKHWVRTPLEREIEKGHLQLIFFSHIEEIREEEVLIRLDNEELLTLPNDVVFILIGSNADLRLLKEVGVQFMESKVGTVPVYNPDTFETNIPGIYVAGHFTDARHIKEAIAVPRRIVPIIARDIT
jgi:thioredoxin reductase (NADPH)